MGKKLPDIIEEIALVDTFTVDNMKVTETNVILKTVNNDSITLFYAFKDTKIVWGIDYIVSSKESLKTRLNWLSDKRMIGFHMYMDDQIVYVVHIFEGKYLIQARHVGIIQ
jgi:hypothetical protein